MLALLALILFDVWRGLHSNNVNQIGYTFDNVNRVVRDVLGTTAQVRAVATKVNKDSQTELDNSAAAVTETRAAVGSFQLLVSNTDRSLNAAGGVLPELAGTVRAGADTITTAGDTIKELGPVIEQTGATVKEAGNAIAHLEPVLDATAGAAANLEKLSGDPDLAAAIHEAAVFGANMDTSSLAWASTSKDIQGFVHRQTAPARWFVTLGKDLAGLGVSAYGVAPK
ncbi:MAG TPA: hypothetical protein VG345_16565 [Bryobacteraceae bacterium]|nr:hypothetical protein [Bryobacteraceae bacterium]